MEEPLEWTEPVVEVLLVEQLETEADLDVAFATTTNGCDWG